MRALRLVVPVVLTLAASGCVVFRRDYDKVVADAAQASAAAEAAHRDDVARIADLQQRLTAAESATQERDGKLADMATGLHNLQAELDEATAINQQLRGELVRLGKDADKLLAERGTLSKALDDARVRLEELRRAQAAAEARLALFRDLEHRFKALIDAGQLRIESRRGQLVMNVSGDLLFDAGRADVRAAGKGALMEIARALQTTVAAAPGRRFLVTSHVDGAPLKDKRFKTAWELTAARAVAVVEYLISLGVPAEALAAAGAASFDPLGPGDSGEARARNRRIEIALQPSPEAAPPSVPGPAPAPAPPPAPPLPRPPAK